MNDDYDALGSLNPRHIHWSAVTEAAVVLALCYGAYRCIVWLIP